jgi:hypothetical protein
MGGACDLYGENRNTRIHWWENLNERDFYEDLGLEGRIILNSMLKEHDGEGMDWINLARNGDQV